MMLNRMGFVVLGLLTVSTFGCPSPQDNDNGATDEGGAGDGTGGTGAGGKGKGGSPGTGGTMASDGGAPGTGGTMASDGGAPGTGGMMTGTGGSGTGGADTMGGMTGTGGADAMGGMTGMGGSGMGGAMGASFATVYTSVIKAGCGCHVTGTPGMLSMKDAMTAYTNLVGVNSSLCPTMKRVVAGDPTMSVLSLVIKGKGTACAKIPDQMPKGKPALSAAQQGMVNAWIMGGAAM